MFVSFDATPGCGRITGLMALLRITFFILILLSRFRLWVFFGGSVSIMIGLGIFLFAVLKWGSGRVFRAPGEEERPSPKLKI